MRHVVPLTMLMSVVFSVFVLMAGVEAEERGVNMTLGTQRGVSCQPMGARLGRDLTNQRPRRGISV